MHNYVVGRKLPPAAEQPRFQPQRARGVHVQWVRHQQPHHLHEPCHGGRDHHGGAGTGFDLADFLLGTPYSASVRYGVPSLYFRGSVYSIYYQDDWRLTPRLSLTFGLRWDYQTPVSELNNQLVNMAFAPWFTAYTTVQPGQANCPAGAVCTGALINPDKNNIAPRLGLAWRPSAKKSTVVRAGYGLYYHTSVYSQCGQPHVAAAAAGHIEEPVPDGRRAQRAFRADHGDRVREPHRPPTPPPTPSRWTPTTRSGTRSNGSSACSRICRFRSRPRSPTREPRAPTWTGGLRRG